MKFEFSLSNEDADRLYAIKKLQGKDNLSGNDFAEMLLHKSIVRLFPQIAEFDGCGNVINKDAYRG